MPDQSIGDPYWGATKGGRTTAAKRTPEERRAYGTRMNAARDRALRERFVAAADPDGTLATTDPDELERRVAKLRSEHYSAMARKANASRKARREAIEQAEIAAIGMLRAIARVGAA